MEVNVDMLEQMDLMDISDQEALDVFFSASGEEGSLTPPLPGTNSKLVLIAVSRFYRLLVGVLAWLQYPATVSGGT